MNLGQTLSAARETWALLAAHPIRWLGVIVLFIVAVEALMFVRYVGFVVKLAVAGVAAAQVVAMFAAAAGGKAPSPLGIFGGFARPVAAQAALAFVALLPFAAGMLYLYLKAGPSAIEFFFGNIVETKPPSAQLFAQSKYVMHFVALPFTLLAGVVVLKGLSGFTAIAAAVAAAVTHWLPVVLLGALALVFEWASVQLASSLPKPAAAVLGGVLLVLFVAWSFAATYTVSARALGVPLVKRAA